jgi:hypothetical protein
MSDSETTYLVCWEVRRSGGGSFEVKSLDDIPKQLAELSEELEEMGLETHDEEDLRYELDVGPVYKTERVPFDEDAAFAKAMPLIHARHTREREKREAQREAREKETLRLLLKKHGSAG